MLRGAPCRSAKQAGREVTSPADSRGDRPIIVTKVRPPRRRRHLLRRDRLIDLLSDNVDRKLILVSAPAGYGKTSLLVDYVMESAFPVCWYRVDESDADQATFFEYLIASLRQRYPGVCERTLGMLDTQATTDVESLVGSLVNEIDEQIGEFFLLILDDYQRLDDAPRVNAAVDSLLYYLPDNCQMIISSRTLPKKLTLTRLAAEGQVVGIGQEQLRLSRKEIGDLVAQQRGRRLSDEECDALARQSEGWVTALVMAAEGLPDGLARVTVDPMSDRSRLFEFLAREVFARQPDDIRLFLLSTCILDGLTPSLCDAVTDDSDSLKMLRRVDERNLFLMPIEAEAEWYRYHQLFRDFLLVQLDETKSIDSAELHRRAAAWYASVDQPEFEIRHLLLAGEYDAAADRMEGQVEEAYSRGRFHTTIEWVSSLPREVRNRRTELLLPLGASYAYMGDLAESLSVYGGVIESTKAANDSAGLARSLAGRAHTLRFLGEVEESISNSKQALELVDDDEAIMGDCHRNLGVCYALRGDSMASTEELLAALKSFERAGLTAYAASTHADLSAIFQLSGDIEESLKHAEAARAQWEEVGNIGALARALNNMATAYHAQGRFQEAKLWLQETIAKAKLAGVRRVEALALVGLADVESDLDHFEEAVKHYHQGLELARAVGEGTLVCYSLASCAEALRLSRRLADAGRMLANAREELSIHRSAYEAALVEYSRGTYAYERGQHEMAMEHLEDASRGFAQLGSKREEARALLYRSAVARRMGDETDAGYWWNEARQAMDDFGYPDSFAPYARRLPEVFAREYIREVGALEPMTQLPDSLTTDAPPVPRGRDGQGPAAQHEPPLVVRAFGAPEIRVKGTPLNQQDWQTLNARDLFLYLVDRPDGATHSELKLAFWPDSSPVRARSSLHSTLYRARRALGKDIIISDVERYTVRLPDGGFYDVAGFEDLLSRASTAPDADSMAAELQSAVVLARAPYLDGVDAPWASDRREELNVMVTEAVLSLADTYARQGKHGEAINAYRRAVEWDALREEAHRGLMRSYAASGDRAMALRQYELLADVLSRELDVDPDPETIALHHAIRDDRELPAA